MQNHLSWFPSNFILIEFKSPKDSNGPAILPQWTITISWFIIYYTTIMLFAWMLFRLSWAESTMSCPCKSFYNDSTIFLQISYLDSKVQMTFKNGPSGLLQWTIISTFLLYQIDYSNDVFYGDILSPERITSCSCKTFWGDSLQICCVGTYRIQRPTWLKWPNSLLRSTPIINRINYNN